MEVGIFFLGMAAGFVGAVVGAGIFLNVFLGGLPSCHGGY